MRNSISQFILNLVRSIKNDAIRFAMLKPLFVLNKKQLVNFSSFYNDRFFIYNMGYIALPSQRLNWACDYKIFEEKIDAIALFNYKIQKGDTIIDIGAGIGEEAIVLAKRVGENGKVYAIEANPQVAEILSRVVSLNKFENVEVHNLAIYKNNTEIFLEDEVDSYIGGTVSEASSGKKTFAVKANRMDSFMEAHNIQKVDLLKSNIEGAERFVVDTLSKENLQKIKNVVISCHDFKYLRTGNEFYKTKEYVMNFLTSNGFEITHQQTGLGYIDDYVYGINKHYQE